MVEKADSSSVLPCPVSISTKNKMNFLFANLKDRDFLVQRISDFLQRTPDGAGPSVSPRSLIGHWPRSVIDVFCVLRWRSSPPQRLSLASRGATTTASCPPPARVCCSSIATPLLRTWDPKP